MSVMPKKPSQKELILKYIKDFGSITTYEAFADIGCSKLTTRISELRKNGYDIIGITEKGTNRWGKPVRYNRYRMGGSDAS